MKKAVFLGVRARKRVARQVKAHRRRWHWGAFRSLSNVERILGRSITGLIQQKLERQPVVRVLDLGCSNGGMLEELADLFPERVELWGTSLSRHPEWKEMESKHPNLRFKVCHLGQLEKKFPKDHFDIVYSSYGIGHASNLSQAVQEVKPVIREGGELLFNTFKFGSIFWRVNHGGFKNLDKRKSVIWGIHELRKTE